MWCEVKVTICFLKNVVESKVLHLATFTSNKAKELCSFSRVNVDKWCMLFRCWLNSFTLSFLMIPKVPLKMACARGGGSYVRAPFSETVECLSQRLFAKLYPHAPIGNCRTWLLADMIVTAACIFSNLALWTVDLQKQKNEGHNHILWYNLDHHQHRSSKKD